MATQHLAPAFVDESKFERVDGQLVARPVPGNLHSDVQGTVYRLLWAQQHQRFKVGVEWSLTRPDTLTSEEPDYLTADVLVAQRPYETAKNGHLIPPAYLAVEVVSPGQEGLFSKAQTYAVWGVENVWIINPQTKECIEYHGGDEFRLVKNILQAESLSVRVSDVFGCLD